MPLEFSQVVQDLSPLMGLEKLLLLELGKQPSLGVGRLLILRVLLLDMYKLLPLEKKTHQNLETHCPQLHQGLLTYPYLNLKDLILSQSMPSL